MWLIRDVDSNMAHLFKQSLACLSGKWQRESISIPPPPVRSARERRQQRATGLQREAVRIIICYPAVERLQTTPGSPSEVVWPPAKSDVHRPTDRLGEELDVRWSIRGVWEKGPCAPEHTEMVNLFAFFIIYMAFSIQSKRLDADIFVWIKGPVSPYSSTSMHSLIVSALYCLWLMIHRIFTIDGQYWFQSFPPASLLRAILIKCRMSPTIRVPFHVSVYAVTAYWGQ